MRNTLAALTFLLCQLMTQYTFAQMGPSNGGGGDVVILPNDDVVLADPFLDHGGNQPNNMPPLRALNPRILQAINLYVKFSEPLLNDLSGNRRSDIALTMKELSHRSNDLRFYAVQSAQELNTFCAPGGRKSYTLPDGATVQNVACTAGNETFLVEPLFIKLSIRDQALLLIHERLTTLRDSHGGKNYSAIARFTTGLKTFLNVAREQSLRSYRTLAPTEANQITEFYIATEEIERRDSDITEDSFMWKSHPYGGGRIHLDTSVAGDALVCLFCKVNKKSFIGPKAQIINSIVGQDSMVGEAALIQNSAMDIRYLLEKESSVINLSSSSRHLEVLLKEQAKIENTSFECEANCTVNLGEKTLIKASTIRTYKFIAGNDVKIVDTGIYVREFSTGNSTEFTRAHIHFSGSAIAIQNNQKMIDGVLDERSFEFAPVGYKIKTFSDSVTFGSFWSQKTYIKNLNHKFKVTKNWSAPGILIKLTYDAKVKRDGLFSEYGRIEFTNCRLEMDVRFGELAPMNVYVLQNGLIQKAGVRKVVKMYFDSSNTELSPRSNEFTEALYRLAAKNGVGIIEDNIYLPVEPPTGAAKLY